MEGILAFIALLNNINIHFSGFLTRNSLRAFHSASVNFLVSGFCGSSISSWAVAGALPCAVVAVDAGAGCAIAVDSAAMVGPFTGSSAGKGAGAVVVFVGSRAGVLTMMVVVVQAK